ncbi:MAG: carboxylating nicotinate-nucleotide diphosphorylase [Candidatus Pseudoruminococcus sp.]|uniref:carboxylating nicotinate-nucleotide diphosphorylase n=1 Tax=Candidatus Pseudoruminococcus sp. TaxID=3101048 RepID=UPI002A79F37B|nr:carboxylating nicotinate-nucleotide diphosphorylase [Ruminococcus sp.]MDY2782630.1 carboxylating nicotinate-nucleotide diphosphorylase [Candidatus Pseudoruminococcus sp.]
MILNKIYVDNLIKTALLEDINYCDVTTDYLIPAEQMGKGRLVAKAEGILCGAEVAARVFELIDSDIKIEILIKDGESVKYGDEIMRLEGRTASLLKGERTALNLIQHMSGIATAANQAMKIVEGTNASIADTRKTLPGMRPLQKYAVMTGGAKNHRYNLSDAAMLKDNHIDAAGGITAAVTALRKKIGHMTKIEVETRNLDELKEALAVRADIIMLDNMSPELMKEAVAITNGRAVLEASGGITNETLRAVAESGVDIISIGALTHSVKAFDISMYIK